MIANGIDVAKSTVGVMGVTFKENCPDIRNSKVVDLVRELKDWGVKVRIADCWADPSEVMREYGLELVSVDEFNNMDSLVVAVGHDDYKKMSLQKLKAMCKSGGKPVIADIKSLFDRNALAEAGFSVFRL